MGRVDVSVTEAVCLGRHEADRGVDGDGAGDKAWDSKYARSERARPIAAESRGHRPAQSPKTVGPDSSSEFGFSLCDNGVGCFEAPVRTWRFRSIPDHWR